MIRDNIFHNKRYLLKDSELLVVYKRGSGWKVLVFANFEMRRRGRPSTRRKRGLDPLDFGKSAILMFSIVQYISVFFHVFSVLDGGPSTRSKRGLDSLDFGKSAFFGK